VSRYGLPVRILVADGDGRKLQLMFVFHGDVNAFGMRQKIVQFGGDEV